MSHEDFTLQEDELNALRENLPATVEETATEKFYPVPYSIDVGKRICNFAAEGKSLKSIAKENGMPSFETLIRWKRENAEFSKMLRSVRETRALLFEEAAIDEAEALEDPKMVGVAKTKIDTYWKAAEVNDPATYGKKVEHKGSVDSKVTFNVITGFGPPNKWQTPPRLRADGTIDKAYEDAIRVESEVKNESVHQETTPVAAEEKPVSSEKEVASGPRDENSLGEAESQGHTRSAQEPRSEDTGRSDVNGDADGVLPL